MGSAGCGDFNTHNTAILSTERPKLEIKHPVIDHLFATRQQEGIAVNGDVADGGSYNVFGLVVDAA